ncbi:MAG: DUF3592 domain-containing protein [Clostridiales bacterium]|nr:DUF3592 domain-containing protein [Clostridiales bacterium]
MKRNPLLPFFMAAFALVGLFITFLGAKDVYEKEIQSRRWVETAAVYTDKKPYESTEEKTTYWLYYSFLANNEEYTVMTDYVTGNVPELGSWESIKYDPDNPERVVFTEQSANLPLLLGGLVFLTFPCLFLAFSCGNMKAVQFIAGFCFAVFGAMFYLVKCPLLFAIAFWTVGCFLFIQGIRTRNPKGARDA